IEAHGLVHAGAEEGRADGQAHTELQQRQRKAASLAAQRVNPGDETHIVSLLFDSERTHGKSSGWFGRRSEKTGCTGQGERRLGLRDGAADGVAINLCWR